MKYGRSLQELAIELDRQAKVKKDYVATAGAMQMTAVNENFDLVIGNTPFQLNENAHRQLGLQLKIPAPYYERMRAENPGLLMANVNGWFQQSPDTRRMVRTLDGTARAILSDRTVASTTTRLPRRSCRLFLKCRAPALKAAS